MGPNVGQLSSLDQVPWESLAAGDTVRIFHRATPYAGKFLIAGKGTASAPVRVCGVKSASGERPVITGQNAVTRRGLAYGNIVHEQRGLIMVKSLYNDAYTAVPTYVQIDGLKIQGATPSNSFTDSNGQRQNYMEFGACVWVERGHNVTIADNEITDCTHAIFSRSNDEGSYTVTKNLRIAGNYIHNNGVTNNYTIHQTYVQSQGVVYEFNRFGPLRSGATGNAIKDRSTGVVIRYNRIEDGARALDLVEAEDMPNTAKADPTYRATYVYGNQIIKDGRKGSTIHYGGDHPGSENNYRKGTLYFFNNTVRLTGNDYAVLFQLSTTEERAEVWNNVFMFDAAIPYPRMRAGQDNAPGIPSGGIVNLGRNWIDARWSDAGPYHTVGGQLNGVSNLITGTGYPADSTSMLPLSGSALLDAATANALAGSHTVSYQLDSNFRPATRSIRGSAMDLGAVER